MNKRKVKIPPVSLLTSEEFFLSVISNVSSPEERSAPAQKAFPDPVKITALIASSVSAISRASKISLSNSPEKVFIFSGLLKQIVKILFFTEVSKLLNLFILFFFFFKYVYIYIYSVDLTDLQTLYKLS